TVSAGTLSVDGSITTQNVSETGGIYTQTSGTLNIVSTTSETVTLSGSASNIMLNDGLVGYWKLDESSLGTVTDSSGFGYNGTHGGSPTIDTDVPTVNFSDSHSVSFKGTSQYIDLGNPAQLNNITNKITLSAWIKPATVIGNHVIVGKAASSTATDPFYVWNLFQVDDALDFRFNQLNLVANAVLTAGVWQHVTGTFDGSTMRIYVNGVQVATRASSEVAVANSQNVRIAG